MYFKKNNKKKVGTLQILIFKESQLMDNVLKVQKLERVKLSRESFNKGSLRGDTDIQNNLTYKVLIARIKWLLLTVHLPTIIRYWYQYFQFI